MYYVSTLYNPSVLDKYSNCMNEPEWKVSYLLVNVHVSQLILLFLHVLGDLLKLTFVNTKLLKLSWLSDITFFVREATQRPFCFGELIEHLPCSMIYGLYTSQLGHKSKRKKLGP